MVKGTKVKMKKEGKKDQPGEPDPSALPSSSLDEVLEVSQPEIATPEPETIEEILVTVAVYSSVVKNLPKSEGITIGDQVFKPGLTYRAKNTDEVQKAIKDRILIRLSGSFGPRSKPGGKE